MRGEILVLWVRGAMSKGDGRPVDVYGWGEKPKRRSEISTVRTDGTVANDGPEDSRGGDSHGGWGEVFPGGGFVGGDDGDDEGEHGGRDVLDAIGAFRGGHLACGDVWSGVLDDETAVREVGKRASA